MSKGMEAIQGERNSQISRGFDEKHDSKAKNGELIHAAEAHIYAADGDEDLGRSAWPWDENTFRLNTPSSSLAKAGALIAAELDRRFAAGECTESDFGHPFKKE